MGEFQYSLISLMEDRGLNQSKLSKLSGVSKSSLSRYVNGDEIPASALTAIANAMGCTTDEILGLSAAVVSSDEQHLIELYRSLDDDTQRIVLDLLERLAK